MRKITHFILFGGYVSLESGHFLSFFIKRKQIIKLFSCTARSFACFFLTLHVETAYNINS